MRASAIALQVRKFDFTRLVDLGTGPPLRPEVPPTTRVSAAWGSTTQPAGATRPTPARWQTSTATRVATAAQGKDKGVQAGSATSSMSTSVAVGHSPSSPVTWLKAYSLGVACEMPQAAQSVERFHLMQLFAK
jgi:hypothetical protein